ncbi:MAG TPA: GNAT family N-acetyltransferase [Polyangiaceae bacterium]
MVELRHADLGDPRDVNAMLALLDGYARDVTGGGKPLAEDVKARLPRDLAERPGALVLLAFEGEEPAALAIAFEGYSTFAAAPLLNLHDFAVAPAFRGRRIAALLLERLETEARERGCCKITLEVLEHNRRARSVYAAAGYESYELVPEQGRALFLHKRLAQARS